MTAGPGRDSAPRKPERVDSVRALADERVSTAKKNQPKSQPGGSSSATAKKKAARLEVDDDDEEVMPDVVNYELEGRAQRGRGSAGKKQDDVDSVDEMPPPPKATKSKTKKETPKNTPKTTPKTTPKKVNTRCACSLPLTQYILKLPQWRIQRVAQVHWRH
jgi:hypothetical protein